MHDFRSVRLVAPLALAAAFAACSTDSGTADPVGGDGQSATAEGGSDDAEAEPDRDGSADAAGFYALGKVQTLEGEEVDLADYRGKVTLVVNVASRCGYTPQYAGLQELHEELGGDDFAILAFPSNDFGRQEPGTPEQIRAFCTDNYDVSFAMFEKVATQGAAASPVYDKLAEMTGERPSWNFCKYLVSRDGSQAKFFKMSVAPDAEELRSAINTMLD